MTDRTAMQSSPTQGFAIAIVIFGLIIGACYGYLIPELDRYQQMTDAARDATINVNVQMGDLRTRAARDSVDRNKYELLVKDGFLGQQDRLNAARILETLRVKHRISGLEYQIDAVQKNPVLRQSGETSAEVNSSKITLNIRCFLDDDLRDFILAVKNALPGHVSVAAMEIVKLTPPSDELLLDISRGGASELISGTVELQWQVVQHIKQEAGL